jgi:hypothetical protein
LTSQARAYESFELDCRPNPGSSNINYKILSGHVSYIDGQWSVSQALAKGKILRRETQYKITDTSDENTRSWYGVFVNNSNLRMKGVVGRENGIYSYNEYLFNMRFGGVQIGTTSASCVLVTQPPAIAMEPAPPPSYSVDVRGCRAVTDPAQRLACYDEVAEVHLPGLSAPADTPAAIQAPAPIPSSSPEPLPKSTPAPSTTVAALSQTTAQDVEKTFIEAVTSARSLYETAANEMQQGATRSTRKQRICAAVPNLSATDWTGTVASLSSNGDGWGVLSIEIAPKVTVSTTNNAFSDGVEKTLLNPTSEIFKKASHLSQGQKVRFSGTFISSETDCAVERSMTLKGSIQSPDFAFQFADINGAE